MYFVDNYANNKNQLITWLDLFKKFNTFFSYIIFPVYERCFFVILKENLKHEQNGNFDFVNTSITLLKQYINKNYDHILCYEGNEYKHKSPGTEQLVYGENYKSAKELFGNEEDSLLLESSLSSHEQNTLNSIFKSILVQENSIIHPNPSFSFTPEYLNFIPGEKFHRKLMNLIVDSILDK